MKSSVHSTFYVKLLVGLLMATGGMLHVQSLYGQTVTLQLQVPAGVLQPEDVVQIRGDWAGQDGWYTGQELLAGPGGEWSTSVTSDKRGFEYKYVLVRAHGHTEWEPGPNRVYSGDTSINDQIRGYDGEILNRPVRLSLQVDLTGLSVNGYDIDNVAVMGERGPLGWDLPEQAVMMESSAEQIWMTALDLHAGLPVDFPFKFAWQADGVWYWESTPGHIDHLLLLQTGNTSPSVAYRYNQDTGYIEAVRADGAVADNFGQAVKIYSRTRPYGYNRAIELLEQGEFSAAREVYQSYRGQYENYDMDSVDDFDYIWAGKMAGMDQIDQAMAFIEEQIQTETHARRRAYFRYLQGEILFNNDRHEQARQAFDLALDMAPPDDEEALVQGYARLGLGLSWLADEDEEARFQSIGPLMALANTHPDEQMRRQGWQHLEGLSQQIENDQLYGRAMRGLRENGSPTQRGRSRIDWLAHRLEMETPDSLTSEIQWLEGTIEHPELAQRVQLLKAEWLLAQGRRDEAVSILEQVRGENHNAIPSARANRRLNELAPPSERIPQ